MFTSPDRKFQVELSVLLCILIGILCAGFLILTLRAIEGLRESKDSWNTYGRLQIKRVYGFDTDRTQRLELKRGHTARRTALLARQNSITSTTNKQQPPRTALVSPERGLFLVIASPRDSGTYCPVVERGDKHEQHDSVLQPEGMRRAESS